MTVLSAMINPRADGILGDALILSAVSSSIGFLGYKHAFEIPYVATADYVCVSANKSLGISITELKFAYEADSTYLLDGMLLYQTSITTVGIGLALHCTTSVTTATLVGVAPLTSAGAVTGCLGNGSNTFSLPLTGAPVVDTTYPIIINGVLITSTNAGVCTLRMKPETASNSKVTLKKYSTLTIRKVV